MPEWATYLIIALMWIFGFILVVLFVLIMVHLFGNQLKKLGFHISFKDGIGVDVETHQPQTYVQNPTKSQKTLVNTESFSSEQELPQIKQSHVATPELPTESVNSAQDNDIKQRVKNILKLFNGQEFSGTLFGKKIKTTGTILPYDERITFSRFNKVSFLSKTQNMPMDILAETNSGIEVESLKADPFSGFDYIGSSCQYTRLYAICLPSVPNNYSSWYQNLERKLTILSQDSLIWVIISNMPEYLRHKHQNPRILTSTLADIEVLEIELGH